MGILELEIPGSLNLLIYPTPDQQPAVFTVLNFPVDNIEQVVDDQEYLKTNEKGFRALSKDMILRGLKILMATSYLYLKRNLSGLFFVVLMDEGKGI